MKIANFKKWVTVIGLTCFAGVAQAAAPPVPTASMPSHAPSGEPYTLTWNQVPGATTYEVIGEQKGTIAVVTGTSVTRTNPAGNYGYRVRACNASNQCSAYSNRPAIDVIDPPPVPTASLPAYAASNEPYALTWNQVARARTYQIIGEQTGSILQTVSGTSLTRSNPAGNYGYRVRACNLVHRCSAYSNRPAITVIDPPGQTAPVTTSDYVRIRSSFQVTWSAASGDADDYKLYADNTLVDTGSDTRAAITLNSTGRVALSLEACSRELSRCSARGAPKYVHVYDATGPAPNFRPDASEIQVNNTATLTWGTPGGSIPGVRFNLYMTPPGGTEQLLQNTSSSSYSRVLDRPGRYDFRIRGCNAPDFCGASAYTSVNVIVPPAPPLPVGLSLIIENKDRWFSDIDPLIFDANIIPTNQHVQVQLTNSGTSYIHHNDDYGQKSPGTIHLYNENAKYNLHPRVLPGHYNARLRVCHDGFGISASTCSGWTAAKPIVIIDQLNNFENQAEPQHSLMVYTQPDPRKNHGNNLRPAGPKHFYAQNSAGQDSYLNASANDLIAPYLGGRAKDTDTSNSQDVKATPLFDGFKFWAKEFIPDRGRTAMARDFMVDPIQWSLEAGDPRDCHAYKFTKETIAADIQNQKALKACNYLDANGLPTAKKSLMDGYRKATKLNPAILNGNIGNIWQKSLTRQYFDDIFGIKSYGDTGSVLQRHFFSDGQSWLQGIDTVMGDKGLSGKVSFTVALPSMLDFMEGNMSTNSEQFKRMKYFIDEAVEQYTLYKLANPNTRTEFYGFDITREEFCAQAESFDPNKTVQHPKSIKYACAYRPLFIDFYSNVFAYIEASYPGLKITGQPYNDATLQPTPGKSRNPFHDKNAGDDAASEMVLRLFSAYDKWIVDQLDKVYFQFGAQQGRTFNRQQTLSNAADSKTVMSDNNLEPVDREMIQTMLDLVITNPKLSSTVRDKFGFMMESSELFYRPVAERALMNGGVETYQANSQAHRYSNHVYYSDYLLKKFGHESLELGLRSGFVYDDAVVTFACLVRIANGTPQPHCPTFNISQQQANDELDILVHFIRETQRKRRDVTHPATQSQAQQWVANNAEVGNPYRLRNPGYASNPGDTIAAIVDPAWVSSNNLKLNVLARLALPENNHTNWRVFNNSQEKVTCSHVPVVVSLFNDDNDDTTPPIPVAGYQNKPMELVDFALPVDTAKPYKLAVFNSKCSDSTSCDSEDQGIYQVNPNTGELISTGMGIRDRDQWRQLQLNLPAQAFSRVELSFDDSRCNATLADSDYNPAGASSPYYLKLYRPQIVAQ